MSKISRRKFLGTAAGATAVSAFPHVWIRPAWAQAKEVRVLAWTHFVPSYDKYFDAFAEQWSTKNGIKVIIDHVDQGPEAPLAEGLEQEPAKP